MLRVEDLDLFGLAEAEVALVVIKGVAVVLLQLGNTAVLQFGEPEPLVTAFVAESDVQIDGLAGLAEANGHSECLERNVVHEDNCVFPNEPALEGFED